MYSTTFRGTAETNKVLRNTFLLLALTLIPTVGGTMAAIALGLPALMAASPWLSLFAVLGVAFALIFAINATKDSALGIGVLGVFTFVMGAVLSGVVSAALKMSNGGDLVAMAFLGTAAILAGCATYASTTKRDFSSLGGFLFGSVLAIIAVSVMNVLFFQLSILALIVACVSLVLFSVYLIYDVQKVVNGGESNYIIATTAIYLDLINIFSSLLQILMSIFGNDD
jgi:FtsH-binding integral membrane protein